MFTSIDESAGPGVAISYLSPPAGHVTSVDVRSLPPGTELQVDTRNSRYRFVILEGSGSNALVQGGPYFHEEAKVRINGSLLEGSLLKSGWIELGMRVEIWDGSQRVATSRVRSIAVVEAT
jgi:hypothetical protein